MNSQACCRKPSIFLCTIACRGRSTSRSSYACSASHQTPGLGGRQEAQTGRPLRGTGLGRQGRGDQAGHPASQPARLSRRGAASADRARAPLPSVVPHLRAGGEIVLFDRSWYNRAGRRRTGDGLLHRQANTRTSSSPVPEFERLLMLRHVESENAVLDHRRRKQHLHFLMRINDPLKRWKLARWISVAPPWRLYTKAKGQCRTHPYLKRLQVGRGGGR